MDVRAMRPYRFIGTLIPKPFKLFNPLNFKYYGKQFEYGNSPGRGAGIEDSGGNIIRICKNCSRVRNCSS